MKPLIFGLPVLCLLPISCVPGSTRTKREITIGEWRYYSKAWQKLRFDDCKEVESTSQFFAVVEQKGLWEHFATEKLSVDEWGSPIHLTRNVKEDRIVFWLISPGPNGRFENGNGDDFACEIHVFKDRDGTVQFPSNPER